VREPLGRVYAGDFEDTPAPILEATKSSVGGYIQLLRTLTSAAFNFPMREIEKLQAKGVSVDIVVPEYDIWKPTQEAVGEVGEQNVIVSERVAHAYLALQANLFGQQMREVYKRGLSE